MMNTVAETNMTQAVKDASLPRPLGMKNKKGSASEPQGAMGLVCMVGTMLSSLNTNNSNGDLMTQEDYSPEAQRTTKNQGSISSPISSREPKDSLLMNRLTEEKVAAAAAKIPDNIFDDVEVVYCKLRGDDTCSTVAGDFSDEDSLSSVASNDDGERSSPPWTPVQKNIDLTEDFTDSEDEKEEEIDDDEHVNVAEWHGVAGRLASVFQNALDEDELEEEEKEEKEEEEEEEEIDYEPVDVAEWHGVAGRLASVFQNALDEDELEEEKEEEAVEDGLEKIDIRNWGDVGARMALVFQEAAEEDWVE